jgi:hypothetical protein
MIKRLWLEGILLVIIKTNIYKNTILIIQKLRKTQTMKINMGYLLTLKKVKLKKTTTLKNRK